MAKVRVGVVFGGRSVEHEVSIASASSIVAALDPARYDVTLLAIDVDGRWRLGAPGALPESVTAGEEVTLPAVPGDGTLVSASDGQPAARLDVVFPIVHGMAARTAASRASSSSPTCPTSAPASSARRSRWTRRSPSACLRPPRFPWFRGSR